MINRPNTANFLSKYIDFGQAILAEIKSILRSPDEIPADVWPLSRDRRLKPSTDPISSIDARLRFPFWMPFMNCRYGIEQN